jgi:hypothetical protein
MYCAVDKIFLADTQVTNRVDTRAVVVYMRTPFHKREVMIKLKRLLAQWRVQEATVRDCFPTDLASYGAHLRRTEDSVRRYQVINRSGEPVLQVASANGRYTDQIIDEEALRELIAGQDKTRAQRVVNRGKTGPCHTAKNRRTKASRNSSGRSSPMATDQEDGPAGPTIPAGSSNAVPQGPQRRTTNLESTSLRKQAGTTVNRQPQPREAARQAALSRQQRSSPPPQPQRQQQPQLQSPPRSQPQLQYEHQPQPQPHPHPHQPQPQRPEGHMLAVPQPGGGLRRMAPPPSKWPTCRIANSGIRSTRPIQGRQWFIQVIFLTMVGRCMCPSLT